MQIHETGTGVLAIAAPPLPWPEGPPPDNCEYSTQFHRWICGGAPPPPWPQERPPEGWAPATFGPPGTMWFIPEDELERYESALGGSVLRALLKKLRPLPQPRQAGGIVWTTPDPPPPPPPQPEGPMDWLQTTIIGSIDADESVAHVLKWRHSTIENAPITLPEVKAFGDVVRDKYRLFFSTQAGTFGVNGPSAFFSPGLVYREVRTALLRQTAPGPWVEYGAGATQIQHPGEKPTWVIPSQVSAFVNTKGNGTGTALPYEVALGISHNTNFRGARFRGRTYLGPLDSAVMAAGGQFSAPVVEGIGVEFGKFLAAVEAATDYELHIVSQKYCTSAKVIGTRVGKVPDSQRRRRRSKPEAWGQVFGQPVGAL